MSTTTTNPTTTPAPHKTILQTVEGDVSVVVTEVESLAGKATTAIGSITPAQLQSWSAKVAAFLAQGQALLTELASLATNPTIDADAEKLGITAVEVAAVAEKAGEAEQVVAAGAGIIAATGA